MIQPGTESSTRKRAQNPTSDHAHDTAPVPRTNAVALTARRDRDGAAGPVSLTSR